MANERDYYDILGVERGASDDEIKRAFRKLAQQWHPDVNTDAGRDERFKEINEAYQVLSDPQRRQALRHVRPGRRRRRRRRRRASAPGSAASATSSMRSSGAAARRRRRRGRPPAGADLRYDLRLTFEEAIHGDGEGDRLPGPRPLRDLRRHRRRAGTSADHVPPVRRQRRGPPGPPDDAGPDGQRHALRALPRRGPDRRARRATPAAATAGSNGSEPAGDDPGRASTRATRSASRARARPGRAAVRRATSTSSSMSRRTRRSSARARSSIYELTSRSPRRPSARGSPSRPRRRRGDRDQAGHPARRRRSGCAARACRTCAGPARAATCTSSSMSRSRPSSPSEQRELLEALRGESAGERASGRPRHGADRSARVRRKRGLTRPRRTISRRRRRRPPGTWLELAVEADHEAVEAVSEILAAWRPAGRRRAGLRAGRRGPGARIDPARPATVRAYLPAARRRGRRAAVAEVDERARPPPGVRAAADRRARDPDRPRGGLGAAWKGHFPVLRVGRRIVIRPTWRRHRGGRATWSSRWIPGWPSGPGSTPPRASAWPASSGRRRRVVLERRARGSSMSAAARASWRSRRRSLGAARSSAWTPTRSPSSRRRERRRNGSPAASAPEAGACRRRRPYDLVSPTSSRRCSIASPRALARAELRPGRPLLASGIFIDREPRSSSRLRGRRAAGRARRGRRLGGPRWGPGSATGEPCTAAPGRRCYDQPACPFLLILLAVHIAWPSRCSCPRSCCPSRCGRGEPADGETGVRRPALARGARARWSSGSAWRPPASLLLSSWAVSSSTQPWLLVALAIYAAVLVLAFFVQRPDLRRLLGLRLEPPTRRTLACPGSPPALRQLPDGGGHRGHRLADEDEAGAAVSDRLEGGVRRRLPVLPDRRRARSRRASTRTTSSSPSTTSTREPRPHPAHAARAHRLGRRPHRCRRRAAGPTLRGGRGIAREAGCRRRAIG